MCERGEAGRGGKGTRNLQCGPLWTTACGRQRVPRTVSLSNPPPTMLRQTADISTQSLDVLGELTQRYGTHLPNRREIVDYLFTVTQRPRSGLRKRAIWALGAWAHAGLEGVC